MKLLFVIGSLQGGGAEHVLSTVCNNLADRGHEVILVHDFDGRFIILTRRSAKLILTHLKKIPRLVQALGDIITR